MKRTTQTLLGRLMLMLLALLCLPVMAQEELSYIDLTFAGRGESTTVESVTVTNLSRPDVAPVTLSGTDILRLADAETITPVERIAESIGIAQPILTPNPAMGDGTLIFDAKQDGPVRVGIYSTNGMLMESAVLDVQKGRNTARIPSQAPGIYIIKVEGQGLSASTRWICGGSKSFSGIALGGANQWADRSLPVRFTAPVQQSRAADADVEYMEFTEGDVLRFEGKSGQMRTIMHLSPESSHDVFFDFFRCQDAAGYNYPIVRIGDMLWMMEDLRPQTMPGLIKTSKPGIWQEITFSDSAVFVANDRAYYTVNGARKAMPEGWQMPSIDEMYAFVKDLQADTLLLGDFLKDRSYEWDRMLLEGLDTLHLQLRPNGYVDQNGTLMKYETMGAWLTRNTIHRGSPVSFEISALNSRLSPMVIHDKCCGFTVRGCRMAPSVYNEMLKERFTKSDSPSSRRNLPMQKVHDNGPLGEYYTYGADRQSLFFDYSFMTSTWDPSNKCEKRSGILYKTYYGAWAGENKQLVPLDVNGADPYHHLRKVTAQGNAEGYENVVYATWGKPFNAVHPYKQTTAISGQDVVYISIFGDSIHGHAMLNSNRLKLLDADGRDYTWEMPDVAKWWRRNEKINGDDWSYYQSDYKYEYYARAFNLNCIQDQTGDGIEEIVMNVGEKIAVFDGATMKCLHERKIQSTRTFTGSAHMRFDVADVNGDGYEDIVLLVDEEATGGHLYVFSKGNVDEKPIFTKSIFRALAFCDVKVGNMSGYDMPDIAILMRSPQEKEDTPLKKEGYLNVMRLKYNDDMELEVAVEYEQAVDCFYKNSNANWLVGNMNLCFGYFRGHDYNQDLVVGYKLYRWDETNAKPVYVTDIIKTGRTRWSIPADAIVAAQMQDKDKECLYTFEQDFPACGWDYPRSTSVLVERWLDADGKTVNTREDLCSTYFGFANAQATRHFNNPESVERNAHPVLCKFADRDQAKRFKFIKYEVAFSEPRIYAAIAASPYYEDLPGTDNASTTWGKTSSTTDRTLTSDTWGGSVIAGFEHSFSMPFFSSAGVDVEFTAKVSASASIATEREKTISYGQSYSTTTEHGVVMQATPYEVYTYEIIGTDDPDEMGTEFVVAMPRQRTFIALGLQDYVRLTADQKGVGRPQDFLTSTPGQPFTYPTNYDNVPRIIRNDDAYPFLKGKDPNGADVNATAEPGGIITTRSISLSSSGTNTTSVEIGVETELVTTAGGTKVGVGFNYGHTMEKSHTIGQELAVEGSVIGMPSGVNPQQYPSFRWNLVWYYVKDANGEIYPVVNYIVTR